MSNLEHLIENTLCDMEKHKLLPYKERIHKIETDDNFEGVDISANDIYEICCYILYTYCAYCTKHDNDDNDKEENKND